MKEQTYILLDLERTISSGQAHYWNQNRHGYTRDIAEAGKFAEDVALEAEKNDFDRRTIAINEQTIKGIFKN